MSEQPDHLADNHATVSAGAAGAMDAADAMDAMDAAGVAPDAPDALMVALRRHYAVPRGNAPFLTFDAIARHVSDASGADDPSVQFSALAAAELAAAEQWGEPSAPDDVSSLRAKEAPMTPYESAATSSGVSAGHGETFLPPPPADPIDIGADATPYRSVGRGLADMPAHRPPTRQGVFARGLLAVAAAILIVALLGSVFYAFGFSHRSKGPVVHHIPPVVHYLGAKAQWQAVSQLPNDNITQVYFAQSDPNDAYEIAYDAAGLAQLKRSTDGGATWQAATLPTKDFPGGAINNAYLTVSPANPQALIAHMLSGAQNPNCPPDVNANNPGAARANRHAIGGRASAASTTVQLTPMAPTSGGYSCTFQYVSRDGGVTWNQLQLSGGGKLGSLFLQTSVDAAGVVTSSRVYSLAYPDTNGFAPFGSRLMVSVDGGAAWTFADAPLIAQGWTPFTVAPTGTGETIFADTVPMGLNSGDSQAENSAPHEFWRSDDAGAHWTNLGKTPSLDLYGDLGTLFATQVSGQTLLYSALINYQIRSSNGFPVGGGSTTPDSIYVSVNGGKTWRQAPKAGVVPGLTALGGVVGALSDGSVVYRFTKQRVTITSQSAYGSSYQISDEGSTFYSWKPGAATWMQLTPHLDEDGVNSQWLAPASNGQPQTIWAFVTNGNDAILEKCALT